MKYRINLVTMADVREFVEAIAAVDADVKLIDSAGHCVNATSILGVLYTMEWKEVYCECDKDISTTILPWII